MRAFENLAREQGMDVKVTSVNPVRVVYGAVTSSGSLTSLICLAVLFCTAIMGVVVGPFANSEYSAF